jgi:hypothetical protein
VFLPVAVGGCRAKLPLVRQSLSALSPPAFYDWFLLEHRLDRAPSIEVPRVLSDALPVLAERSRIAARMLREAALKYDFALSSTVSTLRLLDDELTQEDSCMLRVELVDPKGRRLRWYGQGEVREDRLTFDKEGGYVHGV